MSRDPGAAPVEASIVIVAWRLVNELQECLDALAASINAPSFEVIVVLNGASPDSAQIAMRHPVVSRVITRSSNVGFGAACNLAASVAIGRNLIFLNDDTRVDRHWLASLVGASDAKNGKRAVASLLLNYDGSVQEAGSRLLSHGGTLQWGANLTLTEAERDGLLEPRQIDYGSGAALLVKRSDFEKVGGFDPIFEPAYFEDVDLQLRLREIGVEVWLEPRAIVLHHSGRSTVSDHWFRQFAANRSGHRFIERWTGVLATAPTSDDPVSKVCEIPIARRDVARNPIDASTDDSALIALRIAHDYQDWLSTQLDQLKELHVEISADPNAPTRRELIDRLHLSTLRARELTIRLADVESRGVLGITKMRVGIGLKKLTSRFFKRAATNGWAKRGQSRSR